MTNAWHGSAGIAVPVRLAVGLLLLAATSCRPRSAPDRAFQGRLVYESSVRIEAPVGDDTPLLLLTLTIPRRLDLLLGSDRMLTQVWLPGGQRFRHLTDLAAPNLYLLDTQRQQAHRIAAGVIQQQAAQRRAELDVRVHCTPDTLTWRGQPCDRCEVYLPNVAQRQGLPGLRQHAVVWLATGEVLPDAAALIHREVLCLYPPMRGVPVRVQVTQRLGPQALHLAWELVACEPLAQVPLTQTAIPVQFAQTEYHDTRPESRTLAP